MDHNTIFIQFTFNGVRNVLPIYVHGNQTTRKISHLPFVIDNVLQFHLWAAVIMVTSTSDYRDICLVRFVTVLLVFGLENSEPQTFEYNIFCNNKTA